MPLGSEHWQVEWKRLKLLLNAYLMQLMRSLIPVGSNAREGIKLVVIDTDNCPVSPQYPDDEIANMITNAKW